MDNEELKINKIINNNWNKMVDLSRLKKEIIIKHLNIK